MRSIEHTKLLNDSQAIELSIGSQSQTSHLPTLPSTSVQEPFAAGCETE